MSASRSHEAAALVDALGDFLLFLRRETQLRRVKNHRKTASSAAEIERRDRKHRILTWVRTLSENEWMSLCTIVDAGYVKTVLAMGMAARTAEAERARRRRMCSVSLVTRGKVEFQLMETKAKRVTGSTEPKEFLRRPVQRTRDGDTLSGFQSQSYIDACTSLEEVIYVLNTTRSCDTLCIVATDNSKRSQWLNRLDIISGGQFLLHAPSDQELQQLQPWGQTTWFASRSYFALTELIVNQLEMAVWYHWSQAQKSTNYQVPVLGITAKQIFTKEWTISRESRKLEALKRIASQAMEHLKHLSTETTNPTTRRIQLSALKDILGSWQTSNSPLAPPYALTMMMFAQPLERILASPQSAAVSFLIAEILQEECAKIIAKHLVDPPQHPVDEHPKNTHAQRRRAARKKIAKQRKLESEFRHEHEHHLRAVCAEIPRKVKEWNNRSFQCVREALTFIVDAVVAASDDCASNIPPEISVETSVLALRSRRKKKRGKKKSKRSQNEANVLIDAGTAFEVASTMTENHGGTHSTLLNRDEEKLKVTDLSGNLKQDSARPLLSFLASSDDNTYAASRASTFGTHPFYPLSSPLYLQLSSNRDASNTYRLEEADVDDEEADATDLPGSSNVNEPKFDWYLPSLFSSQSSVHTSSTVSSLDWDFQRWNTKTDSLSRTSSSKGNKLRPLLKTTVEGASPDSSRPLPVSPVLGEDGSSTDSSFALNAFANIIDTNDEASVKSDTLEGETVNVPGAQTERDSGERSDFLYREGGFFDRQRGPKRRRRPFPFEYDDDLADDSSVDGGGDRSWGQRLSNASEKGRQSIRSETSTNNSVACTCKGRNRNDDERPSPDLALLVDRVCKLESLLEELSVNHNKDTSPSVELNGLQQQVSMLSERIMSLEAELEEVRRVSNNANVDRDPPPPPRPPPSNSDVQQPPDQQHPFPVPMVPSAQSYPHPIMRPGGASNYSILGPFVSVPMSVLPPRSKLHWDMCEFVSQLQHDSNARLSAQMAAIRFCTTAVQSLWPRAQVRPYGSFVTRLALPTSDVDLVICLPKVRRDAPADAAGVLEGRNAIKESWQQNLARKLRQEPWVVSDSVKTIPHAAIPIISLVTTLPFNVRLDISFEGPGHNGLATNDVVLSLMHEFPPLAPIMLVLKSFVIERGFAVAYSGGLSSYALLLMIARYLQEHTDRFDSNSTSSASASSSADFGMVLMGLLDFYGNRFEPRTTGISVATRCFFDRDSIVPSHQNGYAPPMHSVDDAQDHWQQVNHSHLHSANLLSSPGSRRHNNRTSFNDWPTQRVNGMADMAAHDPHKFDPLFIEDPLHPSNNVGRNCFRITQIRRAFAAGYEILMAASMSTSVFSENRTPAIGGVALHPENILRAILGPSSPAFKSAPHNKNENGAVSVPPAFQPPKPRGGDRSGTNGVRYSPYDQHHGHAPYPGGVSYNAGQPATPPMYVLQRSHRQYHQHPYSHFQVDAKLQPRSVESGATHRRHSGSVSDHMTTRSEAAVLNTKFLGKRGKAVERSLALSPRLTPPTMHRSSSIELDKKVINTSNSIESNGSIRGMLTRKNPSRSMSFADVVVSGGGAATVEAQRKVPSSPLALVRSARRYDTGFEETIVERLETKDDFELK